MEAFFTCVAIAGLVLCLLMISESEAGEEKRREAENKSRHSGCIGRFISNFAYDSHNSRDGRKLIEQTRADLRAFWKTPLTDADIVALRKAKNDIDSFEMMLDYRDKRLLKLSHKQAAGLYLTTK